MAPKTAFASVPQPRAYPFVGNAPSIDIEAPVQSMMQLARELGPVYRLQFPSQTALVVGEHRLVDELSDATRFEKIVHAPLRQLRDLGGDGLFTADNDEPEWANAHRLLMPAFGAAGDAPLLDRHARHRRPARHQVGAVRPEHRSSTSPTT